MRCQQCVPLRPEATNGVRASMQNAQFDRPVDGHYTVSTSETAFAQAPQPSVCAAALWYPLRSPLLFAALSCATTFIYSCRDATLAYANAHCAAQLLIVILHMLVPILLASACAAGSHAGTRCCEPAHVELTPSQPVTYKSGAQQAEHAKSTCVSGLIQAGASICRPSNGHGTTIMSGVTAAQQRISVAAPV